MMCSDSAFIQMHYFNALIQHNALMQHLQDVLIQHMALI